MSATRQPIVIGIAAFCAMAAPALAWQHERIGPQDTQRGCTPSSQPQSIEVLAASGLSVPMRTARMIGVRASSADAGQSQALRVTATGLAPPFDVWNGQSMWVGPPVEYSEFPSVGYANPGQFQTEDTYFSSTLDCEPFFTDWTLFGDETIWIRGEFIVSSTIQVGGGGLSAASVYAVQLVDETCPLTDPDSFSTPMSITTAGWADIAELSAGEARAVNDTVAVEELVFMLQKFSGIGGGEGAGGLPIIARTDMVGSGGGASPILDGLISTIEIVVELEAFVGAAYPFVPSAPVVCP